jgi:predicted dehydrogenase
MKQIVQNFKTGNIEIMDVPCPKVKPGHLIICTSTSLVSSGTERMVVELGKSNLVGKARQNPDRVRQVLDMARTDGLISTIEKVRVKLDQILPLGYSNVGVVVEVGKGVTNFSSGDRVVSNGFHAEVVRAPKNLCIKVPHNVNDESAAFTVIGAIGLQGIRLIQPELGESIVVIGLGLIGLTAIQLLQAHGCRVLGIDYDPARCYLAQQFGADTVQLLRDEDPVDSAMAFSRGVGVDGVLITAATKSNEPIHQAAQMCRKRGRIVLVGVTGLELRRSDFYEKELSFQVSCSYGPGRYDPEYEEKGHDYPVGYARWTVARNFETILDLMSAGKLDVDPLITHRFELEEASKAYQLISENKMPYLGIIFSYNKEKTDQHEVEHSIKLNTPVHYQKMETPNDLVIGFIGAGGFASHVLLPALKKTSMRLKTIASSGGWSGTDLGNKFGFEFSTTDTGSIFDDLEVNTVFISTRHDTHAAFVIDALKSGKHVFVEKPLCIKREELDEIVALYSEIKGLKDRMPLLMVGFNRRFAPHILKIKELLETVKGSKSMIMTVNAGITQLNHWTQDPLIGGGRIIGEVCHFIDLLRSLVDSEITRSDLIQMKDQTDDTVSIQLDFGDGSIGTIHYFANGNKKFPKERLEVFCGGRILQLDNFKVLRGWGWKGFRKMRLWKQDKGHVAEVKNFVEAVHNGGPPPISFDESVEVSRVTFQIAETLA